MPQHNWQKKTGRLAAHFALAGAIVTFAPAGGIIWNQAKTHQNGTNAPLIHKDYNILGHKISAVAPNADQADMMMLSIGGGGLLAASLLLAAVAVVPLPGRKTGPQ